MLPIGVQVRLHDLVVLFICGRKCCWQAIFAIHCGYVGCIRNSLTGACFYPLRMLENTSPILCDSVRRGRNSVDVALQYIHSHLNEPLSLSRLATLAGLSL